MLPPLPVKAFVSGRISTQQDVAVGHAAFAAPPEQDLQRQPIDVPIPSYAIYLADGKNELVFVIQAEFINGEPMIGARLPDGGDIVGTARDFQFLGANPQIAP